MENRHHGHDTVKNVRFEPKIAGLWNFGFIDSGTGSSVYKADSLIGERAVKFYNLEGSEKVNLTMLRNHQKKVQRVSRWIDGMRDDLRIEVYKEGDVSHFFTWEVNPIQSIGEKTVFGKKIPFSVSPWINGYPLSNIFDGKVEPNDLVGFDKSELLDWLKERLDLKRRQNRIVNPYAAIQEFIPIARNVLLVPGANNRHRLVVVDIADYLDPRDNPLKKQVAFRVKY